MGIDLPIKCVIIIGCPSSIDEYFQLIGRAGRDNNPSHTFFFFAKNKFFIKKKLISNDSNPLAKLKIDNLYYVTKFVSILTCRRKFILEYYNEICDFFICNNCDNCCNNNLSDMTNLLWQPIMNNSNLQYYLYNFDYSVFNKWKHFIIINKLSINNIPNKLKLFLHNKLIKNKNHILSCNPILHSV
jgi:superfamily II DNA helicase RecQ